MYYSGNRFYIGRDMGWGTAKVYIPNTIYCENWFRSVGNSGWYNQTYGGGWHMQDSTWIRAYGGKRVYMGSGASVDGNAGSFYAFVSSTNAGGIYANAGNIYDEVALSVWGKVYISSQVYVGSDERIKTNIQTINSVQSLSIIQKRKSHDEAITEYCIG
jgi:hypothetical protein